VAILTQADSPRAPRRGRNNCLLARKHARTPVYGHWQQPNPISPERGMQKSVIVYNGLFLTSVTPKVINVSKGTNRAEKMAAVAAVDGLFREKVPEKIKVLR